MDICRPCDAPSPRGYAKPAFRYGGGKQRPRGTRPAAADAYCWEVSAEAIIPS